MDSVPGEEEWDAYDASQAKQAAEAKRLEKLRQAAEIHLKRLQVNPYRSKKRK